MRNSAFSLVCSVLLVSSAFPQSAPVITAQPQSQTVSAGASVTFSVAATGAGYYYWYDDQVLIPGANGPSYTFTAKASDTGSQIYALLRNAAGTANAQSSTAILNVVPRTDLPLVSNVENFGTAPASQAAGGFGLNVTSYVDWQFAACKSIHCSWVRFDCPWSSLELQSMPSNTSGGFSLGNASNCSGALTSSHSYGLHPSATAYWGPPYSNIAVGTTAADIPIGSKSISIAKFKSGSLSSAVAGQTTVTTNAGIGTPTATALYEGGALVDTISGNTLSLAMPTDIDIPKGSTITVSLLLYPPVLFSPSQTSKTSYMSNPSLQAFDNYVHFLATAIASTGDSGTVELWNEPEQNAECWDYAPNCYATPPAHFAIQEGSGVALALSVMSIPPVNNVKYANGWTDTNGAQSIYNPAYSAYFPASIAQANQSYAWESFHVYGNMPEESNWIPSCLQANSNNNAAQNIAFACTPIGGETNSNFKYAASLNLFPQAQGGLHQGITETGICRTCQATIPTETQVTRFNLRQFLAYQANGVSPVIFFDANGAPAFDWFRPDQTPYPVATAFGSLMTDLATVSGPPVGSITGWMPQVTSYSGYYPLATASFVGTAPGATQNSLMYVSWQKTYTVPAAGGNGVAPWFTLPSPGAVNETIQVLAGYSVSAVKDLVTQTAVPYSLASGLLTFAVADNPVEVILSPAVKVATLQAQTITFPALSNTTFGASPLVMNATSTSGLPISYSASGPVSLSGSNLMITGTGTVTVTAAQSGNSTYAAATSVTQTISVSKATPVVTWAAPASISSATSLGSTELNASATVPGTFTYSPATGTVLPVGIATLTVTFTPTNSADYNTASAQTTISVSGLPPIIWVTPAPIAYGTPLSATQLNATSSVAGAFTYSQPIGRIFQAGAQQITVQFTPTNTTVYSAASAQVTLTVTQLTPIVSNAQPGAITYGTSLTAAQLNASSQTPGTFTYSPAAGTVPSAGVHTITTVFTPTDTVDYVSVTTQSTLQVNQVAPVISWFAPLAMSALVPLSSAQLNASSTTPGTFTYTPTLGTMLAAGTHILSVTFTPTDSVDYSPVTLQTLIVTSRVGR